MISAPSQPAPHPSLPTLTPDSRHLLTRFFALSQDPLALELGKDLLEILISLANPNLAAWVRHYHHLITARRRELALQTLESICKSSPDPIEQSRAATRLLSRSRAIEVDEPSSAAGAGGLSSSMRTTRDPRSRRHPNTHPDLPTTSPFLIRPNPKRSAEQTLSTLIHVIATRADSPTQARATLNEFFNPDTTVNETFALESPGDVLAQIEHDPAFHELQLLTPGVTATPHPPTINTKTDFEQTYTLTHNDRTAILRFTLTKFDTG